MACNPASGRRIRDSVLMAVYSMFSRSRLNFGKLAGALLALLPVACAGAGKSSRSADDTDSETEGSTLGAGADGDFSSEAEPGPTGPDCSDGTCFVCGDGMCPVGFYCDERASGGSACSWLPECADNASCACVTGVLGASCTCDERAGGPSVSCE
jgi:hypothetical protein